MKRNYQKGALLLLFSLALYPLSAQKRSFFEGYIIEQRGDTIYGLIKDRSPEPFVSLYSKVRFRAAGTSRTRKYGPRDIWGYGYQGQDFISMPLREESQFFKFRYYTDASAPWVFLRVVQQSKELIYLEQLFIHDDNSYLDSFPLFYRPNSNELVRVTQGILGFKRKQLAAYFSDCPALIEELQIKKPIFRNVPELYEFCLTHCFP